MYLEQYMTSYEYSTDFSVSTLSQLSVNMAVDIFGFLTKANLRESLRPIMSLFTNSYFVWNNNHTADMGRISCSKLYLFGWEKEPTRPFQSVWLQKQQQQQRQHTVGLLTNIYRKSKTKRFIHLTCNFASTE